MWAGQYACIHCMITLTESFKACCRAEHEQVSEAADPNQPPPPMHGLHVIGVLEQVGDDVMRENFWNYGQCRYCTIHLPVTTKSIAAWVGCNCS